MRRRYRKYCAEFGPAVRSNGLNLADRTARSFPQIYLDADIMMKIDAIRVLARRLEQGDVLAVARIPHIDLSGCSRLCAPTTNPILCSTGFPRSVDLFSHMRFLQMIIEPRLLLSRKR